jgi:protein transport protein SEC24
MLPTHLFLVDVSYAAVSSGATAAVCSAIQQTLDSLPGAAHLAC